MAIADRFWRKVDVTAEGCWLWTGFVDKGGYARRCRRCDRATETRRRRERRMVA